MRRSDLSVQAEDRVVLTLSPPHRGVSSTLVGGGIGPVGSWLNLQVPLDYDRMDPEAHLLWEGAALPGPLAATMTAAAVADVVDVSVGGARVIATVGVSVPLAAAGRREVSPTAGTINLPPKAGTINLAAVLEVPLSDAGLVNAVQTLTEAKAQALAEGGLRAVNHDGWATGTATDSVLIACRPAQDPPPDVTATCWAPPSAFAGPATPIGRDLARATHAAITEGLARWRARHP